MTIVWLLCLAFLGCALVWFAWKDGPRKALGVVSMLALIFPKWIVWDWDGIQVDLRVASGILALSLYCVHRKSLFLTRLTSIDYGTIALIVINIATDFHNDGMGWLPLMMAYGEWFVPYVLGRLAIDSYDDAKALLPFAILTAVILSMAGIIECLSNTNVYEWLFGQRPSEQLKYIDRLGWRRAFGPTENPIYFGTLLLLLLPWTLHTAYESYRSHVISIWQLPCMINLLGIASSISRAPILAVAIVLVIPVLVLGKRWRWVFLTCGLLSTIALVGNIDVALRGMHAWSGDSREDKQTKITIDGKQVAYTSTLHRFYLWKVYGKAIRQAGLLGYGSDRTSIFPPQVPMGGEHDAQALKKLWCIDNQYLLILLRMGWLGLAAWGSILVAAGYSLFQLATQSLEESGPYFAAMLGGLIATFFVLATVWMPHDFGFPLLWHLGAAAGAYSRFLKDSDDY